MECRYCVGYPNYLVFADGKVYSLKSQKFLRENEYKSGYTRVWFWENGKCIEKKIHRLVAEAFIPNPENKPEVNHINGNKADNRVENLEWCTHHENMIHAFNNGLAKIPNNNRKIAMLDKDGNLIQIFSSAKEASDIMGISDKHIGSVCNGNRNFAGGYKWKRIYN